MTAPKSKLLRVATERFLSEGFYKTSIDEISSELKMSKKTIYTLFPSKHHLVREAALTFVKSNFKQLRQIVSNQSDAIGKLSAIMSQLARISTRISNNFLRDLQTHMEDVWLEVEKFRSQKLYELMGGIILQGQKEGLILPYPPQYLTDLCVKTITSIITPANLIKHDMSLNQMFELTIGVLLRGISTEKGYQIFIKYKESEKK